MPSVAVLAGLLLTCMPTGSGKSALCKFLKSLVERARQECNLTENDPCWCLDDQSFEKMGAISLA